MQIYSCSTNTGLPQQRRDAVLHSSGEKRGERSLHREGNTREARIETEDSGNKTKEEQWRWGGAGDFQAGRRAPGQEEEGILTGEQVFHLMQLRCGMQSLLGEASNTTGV